MTKRKTSIAKITRPAVSGIFPRKRLFKLLDSSREKPVIWVSGPAGSGKTTLVASYLDARNLPCIWYQVDEGDSDIATFFYYMGLAAKKAAPQIKRPLPLLTPEYLPNICVFSQRYFENLSTRLKPPFVLVLDDYHALPRDSLFHEAFKDGLLNVSEGIQTIVISRADSPPTFSVMFANNKMTVVGLDELRLTSDESKGIVGLHSKGRQDRKTIEWMHEKTRGWAAGLVLLTKVAKREPLDPQVLNTLGPDKVFDYFASEVLDKLDSETRDFLLTTAFLPKMTATMAERMTDQKNSGRILAALNSNNFFTEKQSLGEPSYQYHPLFREFLLTRMKGSLSPAGFAHLQNKAADLLENSGQVEDAAHLFLEARDWAQLARLALRHAPSLAAQGRNRTLEEWLSDVPAEILEQNPLLLYWLGVCRIPYDLHESRGHFERAYGLFKRRQDATGLYLSWSGVAETYILERSGFTPLDHWISEIEGLLREHPDFPSPEIKIRITAMIFFAMMYRRPDHPDFRLWEKRLLAVLPEVEDVGLRTLLSSHLVFYYSWWSGELAKAELLIKDLRHSLSRLSDVHPFAYIVFRANEAAHFMVSGRSDLSQEAVEDALRTAEVTGILGWDFMLCLFGAHNALSDGDFEKSRRFLDRAGRLGNNMRHLEVSHYHFQLAWEALCLGNTNAALEHVKTAISMSIESGAPFLEGASKTGLAEVLLELGRHEEALKALEEARAIGRSCNSKTMEFQALLIQARIFLRLGKTVSATEALRGHLRIGRECGIYSTPWWRPAIMAEIYSIALEEGIETEYVREVIRRRNLVPDPPFIEIETWPWKLKIFTFGRFEVILDGEPVQIEQKAVKKPMELLKALITFGEEGADTGQLIEALWPDAEGDAGNHAFETNLYRLRKLFANADVLMLKNNRLTLNPRYCWIDARAFEHLVRQIDEAQGAVRQAGRKELSGLSSLYEKAARLYGGQFLPFDSEQAWTTTARERLRGKFLRVVTGICRSLEQAGKWKTAIEYYQKGLEMDDLAEEFYQGLMTCYRRLGRRADALKAYVRCKETFSTKLGVEPSPQTEAIYQAVRDSR